MNKEPILFWIRDLKINDEWSLKGGVLGYTTLNLIINIFAWVTFVANTMNHHHLKR